MGAPEKHFTQAIETSPLRALMASIAHADKDGFDRILATNPQLADKNINEQVEGMTPLVLAVRMALQVANQTLEIRVFNGGPLDNEGTPIERKPPEQVQREKAIAVLMIKKLLACGADPTKKTVLGSALVLADVLGEQDDPLKDGIRNLLESANDRLLDNRDAEKWHKELNTRRDLIL